MSLGLWSSVSAEAQRAMHTSYVDLSDDQDMWQIKDTPSTAECVKVDPLGEIQGPHRPPTVSSSGQECTLTW